MATSVEYIEFVCEQIKGDWNIGYKKMFGEYMVYANDKPILLVCDNNVFVKKLDVIDDVMQNADVGVPYKGAKEHYILDVENTELTNSVISRLEEITPVPKPRKKPTK